MAHMPVKDFSKVEEVISVPDLSEIQTRFYSKFLQQDVLPHQRDEQGLESILRETFSSEEGKGVESYDGTKKLHYISYSLGVPRYTPDECRMLKLSYGYPFKIRLMLEKKDGTNIEEEIYMGDIPAMIGGGEFIVNGAERVIVSQLHRSPGVDFLKDETVGDKLQYSCRIIPERGSWIEVNITSKDLLVVRIDQTGKLNAITFFESSGCKIQHKRSNTQ